MKAKDTVMDDKVVGKLVDDFWQQPEERRLYPSAHMGLLQAQAKISFKAGIREALWRYAWWKDGVQYVGTTGTTLKEALKEWGIDL